MLCTRDKGCQHTCTHMCAWVHVGGVGNRPEEAGQKQHLLMAVRHIGQQNSRCPGSPSEP
jgi:hypothetical protein